jgi:REP element-mobilizing transposase RayT
MRYKEHFFTDIFLKHNHYFCYIGGMPGRNILRQDVADAYYHVYARGGNKQPIFLETSDSVFFLSLLKRYLSAKAGSDTRGLPFPSLHDDIQLVSYCLMNNHFHLLVYQINPGSMTNLMRRVMTSYVQYFNKKYQRRGPLFESRFRASRITDDAYLIHITRYIHLNPEKWRTHEFSSINYYLGKPSPDWLSPQLAMELFKSPADYLDFLEDYTENRAVLEIIKHELADVD